MKTAVLVSASLILLPSALGAQERKMNVSLSAMAAAAGVLEAGEREARRTLLVDRAARLTLVVASPVDFRTALRLPDGTKVSAQNPNDRVRFVEFDLKEAPDLLLPGVGRGPDVVVTIEQPPPGELEVRVVAADAAHERIPFTITLLQESEVRLGLSVPKPEGRPGEALVVAALGFEKDRPMKGATITASLVLVGDDPTAPAKATEFALRDDGQGADVKAGDGCYTGLIIPRTLGRNFISVSARGRDRTGLPFARDVGAALEVKAR